MPIRTSATHPLRVDFLPDGLLPSGRIGMTLAPGKHEAGALSGTWERDLSVDLDRLRKEYGADVLVTLNPRSELSRLGIAELPERCPDHGIEHLHFEIEDASVPEDLRGFRELVERVRWRTRLGQTVVIHCKGGLGRTGLLAACVLVASGHEPETSIREVRTARQGAIETPAQERLVREFRTVLGEGPAFDRALGCLLGGAIGDALGAGIKFLQWNEIEHRFGPRGVDDYVEAYGRRGAITDDTQMTLFTGEGVLRAIQRQRGRGVCAPKAVVHHALFRWLLTQGATNGILKDNAGGGGGWMGRYPDGWLIQAPELHSRRAPGNTCLSALRTPDLGEAASNDSKGCGGVMRSAPIGLFPKHEGLEPFHFGSETARLTHGHPSGYLAAGFFADVVARMARGGELARAVDETLTERSENLNDEVRLAMHQALRAAKSAPADRRKTLTSLGEGRVAEEALAIALYCALVARDFRDGVLLAVNHSGDSDSTGAMTGNLLGLQHGLGGLPEEWLSELESSDVIETLARDIAHTDGGAEMEPERYPGW